MGGAPLVRSCLSRWVVCEGVPPLVGRCLLFHGLRLPRFCCIGVFRCVVRCLLPGFPGFWEFGLLAAVAVVLLAVPTAAAAAATAAFVCNVLLLWKLGKWTGLALQLAAWSVASALLACWVVWRWR